VTTYQLKFGQLAAQ